jgi:type I restriction enzyme S subunit
VTLPRGWVETTIGEVCLPVTKHKPEDHLDKPFTYIDISSINEQRILGARILAGRDAPSRARQLVQAGDTVLSTVRTYLRNTACVPTELDGATASTGFCVLRPGLTIDPRFLFHRVLDKAFVNRLSELQSGSSYPAVRDKDVRAMPLALPPLPEQRRIVEAIEEQFSRLDAAGESLKSALARLRTLQAAGLVLPTEEWPKVPFGEVTDNHDGRRIPVKKSDRESRPGAYPYYGAQGIIDTIDDYLFDGDFLLVAEDGANLFSRVKPLAFQASGRFWVNNHAHVVTPRTGVTIQYLEIAVNSLDIGRSITGSAQPKLTQANLNRLLIPLPSAEVQAGLVSRWSVLSTGVHHLEGELRATAARLSRLRASLLGAAFSGRLLPQVAGSNLSEKVSV